MSELKPISKLERHIAKLIETRNQLDRTIEELKLLLPNQGRCEHKPVKRVYTLGTGAKFELET